MHNPFIENNTLQCRLKAAKAELAAFKSGKKYQDMQETHRKEVQDMECRIRQLEEGLAQAHRELKAKELSRNNLYIFGIYVNICHERV